MQYKMKLGLLKVYESEEGLENLGKIHPVTIYDKEFKVRQRISGDELSRREWDNINAGPEEGAKLYRRFMFNRRSAKQKKINYEPVNIESFNEKHKSAEELFEQDQAKLFD